MRYLTANMIYPISTDPIPGGVIVVNDSGVIMDIIDPEKQIISSEESLEKFDGILCPGFVNTHCHLELSHLKNRMTTKSGLPGFISEIVAKREDDRSAIIAAAKEADDEMYQSGIVAVGDISNTDVSIEIKQRSKIHYHSFVELFDLYPERAQLVFESGLGLLSAFQRNNLLASFCPHAPYTVSPLLMNMIADHAIKNNSPVTIHNQETESENEMFEHKKGSLFEKLGQMIPGYQPWEINGKSSIMYASEILGKETQLVHNTFTRREDLYSGTLENYFCLCVNANLFIENRLPEVFMLFDAGCKITLGTDSYASNHSLTIFDEIKTIRNNFPGIPLSEILKWATWNGARFMGIENKFGTLEKGKTPGIVNLNLEKDYSVMVRI
jgi:cytosine/adenosine deaminase-related metal-dependent hydrolase